MDSSGIATLVQAYKESRPHEGQVCLAAPAGNVMRVLKLSNLTALFQVFDTVEAAAAGGTRA
jgi:anti-anti-sigma factor